MVDIAMCNNEDCELKEHCFRYLAKPDRFFQSYLVIKGKKTTCEEYWHVKDEDDVAKYNYLNM